MIKKTSSYGDYYIVKIPCPSDISPNCILSITSPEFDVDINEKKVTLGPCYSQRNVMIVDDYDKNIKKTMSNGEIEEAYSKACAMNRVNSDILYNSESTHDTVSEDLDLEERDL